MQLFGVDIFQEWMKILANFIPNLFGAVLILISGFLSAKFLRDFLRRTSVAAGLEIANSLPTIAYVSTCAITVLVSIKQVGIDVEFLTSIILIVLFCTLLSGAISFGMGSAAIVTTMKR
ncbi:mechanosensitive ion channel family protein [Pseudobacteriovorax antillogorgiicola]|uniref:mechanosensitive ion channel family protein n=1 Tax=Pseudobacteriovorax antillogorgiicola TaxID=1513793 RepID=UPI0010463BEF|nr:hypothetical protein [Pseudobacteriovorax antillogorgiicola]